mgnify:CR=1 FL=1
MRHCVAILAMTAALSAPALQAAPAMPVYSHQRAHLFAVCAGRLAALALHQSSTRHAAAPESRRLQEIENADAGTADGIGFSVGLHAGELLYGNVGVEDRLEFTVVGAAANLVARLERQASERGEPLVLSAEVAGFCGEPVRSLGLTDIRGFQDPVELFVPVD